MRDFISDPTERAHAYTVTDNVTDDQFDDKKLCKLMVIQGSHSDNLPPPQATSPTPTSGG